MKKLLSILTLLLCFSSGVWADEFVLSQSTATSFVDNKPGDGKAITFSSNGQNFSIAKGGTAGTAGKMGDNLLKLSKNATYTITLPEGFTITAINFKGYANNKSGTDVKIDKVNGTDTNWEDFPGNGVASTESSWGNFTFNVTGSAQTASTITFHIVDKQQIGVIITITGSAAPAGLSIKTQPQSAEYSIGATATELTVVAQNGEEPYTYQWYSCDDAEKNNPQPVGDNSASYTPSTAAVGTFYYYCKVTDIALPTPAEVESNVATITVNPKSDACKLYEAKYSNGFNAFIDESVKTVTVYYMAGGDAPTVTGTPDVSANATYDVSDPTKIVVTAEDGTTKATYAVTRTAVTPYNGDGVEFDGSETWVKTGNGYLTTKDDKTYYAWVINRQVKDGTTRDEDPRVALGKTRIYFFVDGAHSIRLYNERGSALNTARDIKVYVNGVLQASPTSMGAWKSDTKPSITIAAGNVPAMIEISSDQKSGDTGWGRIEVIKNKSVEVTDAKWATTTTPNWPVSFDENATVYVVASAEGSIQLTPIAEAPANTPIIVNAAAGSYTMTPKASAAAIETNLLRSKTANNETAKEGDYALGYYSDGVTIGFGKLDETGVAKMTDDKAFIPASSLANAVDFLPFVIGDEENETTSINSIENGELRIENYDYFNLSGQRVSKDYKGIVIVNGKKVIRK